MHLSDSLSGASVCTVNSNNIAHNMSPGLSDCLCPAPTPRLVVSAMCVYSRQCPSGPHLTGCQCSLCTVVSALADWLSVPSVCSNQTGTGALSYRGHRQSVKQAHSGVLSTVHSEGTDNHSDREHTVGQSTVHSEGTDNQSDVGHAEENVVLDPDESAAT